MSISLMAAVWKISLPDSEKLVLLALADCANDDGHCWPSMKTLSDKCSKSDRTIQAAIKSLVDRGHLSRIERPGKGCSYYVHPVRSSGMHGTQPVAHHYTYRITCAETGEFYLGARSSYILPIEDPYMGSGEWIKKAKTDGLSLSKEVICTYPSREALGVGEQELTRGLLSHPLCRNRKVASALNLSPFGGLPPEATSPRSDFAPKGATVTPEVASDKPSRTIIGKEAKASSPKRAANPFPMLDCTDPETWGDFLKNRKLKRLPNTASAYRKLESDLAAIVDRTGWPPGEVFAACVAKGWGAIYDPRDQNDDRKQHSPSAHRPLADIARSVAADLEREARLNH